MIACKQDPEDAPVVEIEDVIKLSDLQVNLGSNLKVDSTISAETIRKGISVNLSINNESKGRKTLDELSKELKDKTFSFTVTNNGETIYTITNNNLPTTGYTFTKENNNFAISGTIGNDEFNLSSSKPFTVGSKEQGGSGKDPVNPDPVNPDPVNPAPVNPDPVNPDPVNPAPVNPAPVNPDPVNPDPPVTEDPKEDVKKVTFNTLSDFFKSAGAEISEGNQQTGTITLTAQTIKKLAALPSDLTFEIPAGTKTEQEAKEKEMVSAIYEKYKDLSNLVNAYDTKEIVVEKNGTRDIGNDYGVVNFDTGRIYETASEFAGYGLGEIYPPVKTVESYKISKGNISLSGTFNYNEIDIKNDGATIYAGDAIFSMEQTYKEDNMFFVMSPKSVFDMYARLFNKSLKDVLIQSTEDAKEDNSKTPTLDYYIHGRYIEGLTDNDISSSIVALHKLYDDNKEKLNLDVNLDTSSFGQYDDSEIIPTSFKFQGVDFFKTGETMFKGNDINSNNDIPNMSADILREVSTKYNINNTGLPHYK